MSERLVISVGNIAMGGTGKTPFTIFIARQYMGLGHKVAILSRGYKGKLGYDTHVISDGKHILYTPPFAADEPYMMARALPGVVVITGKKRIDSYDLAVSHFGADVCILDDGFQHKKMPRDIDVVLLDYKRPISTGFPFPFGYLREFPSGLKRADIIIFTRADGTEIPEAVRKYCEGKLCFFSTTEYSAFISSEGRLPVQALAGKPVWLVSGIARPKEFEKNIRELGAEVCGHSVFRDHHAYTAKELARVMNKAAAAGANFIVTTEKDSVKIPPELAAAFIYPEMSIKMLNEGVTPLIP